MIPSLSVQRVQRFGHYWLLCQLGYCDMGEMWLASPDDGLDANELCVIKKPQPDTFHEPDSIARFLDEIRVTDLLDHPNISKVLDAGEIDGEPFLALDFVEGKSLSDINDRLRETGQLFPLPLTIHLGIRVCDALAYAHRLVGPGNRPLQLVHRNICPDNLLVAYSGGISLIDFGMAYSTLREAQTLLGKRPSQQTAYRSLEHARNKAVDARSDIFSLGAVLWELAAGVSPQQTREEMELWLKSGRPRFVSPSNHRKGVPQQLDYVLMRALNNDPRDRQQKATELQRELQAILDRLAPGYEQIADSEMSQFMHDLFGTSFIEERKRTMHALKSAQAEASVGADDADGEPFDDDDVDDDVDDARGDGEGELPPSQSPPLSKRAGTAVAVIAGNRGLVVGFVLAFFLSLLVAAALYLIWTLLS
ncbi:MAG: serine/threonine protein kinase [Myxococcales bacterium]|jgi:serine/threonine-protein kinase|nr:serine/threonine protein kinase [Myxococcales bacterium]